MGTSRSAGRPSSSAPMAPRSSSSRLGRLQCGRPLSRRRSRAGRTPARLRRWPAGRSTSLRLTTAVRLPSSSRAERLRSRRSGPRRDQTDRRRDQRPPLRGRGRAAHASFRLDPCGGAQRDETSAASTESAGACTVQLDEEPVRSCLMLAVQVDGRSLRTVEAMALGDELHPLQRAFQDAHALQCGFCTPGFLMSLEAFLRRRPDPNKEEIVTPLRATFAGAPDTRRWSARCRPLPRKSKPHSEPASAGNSTIAPCQTNRCSSSSRTADYPSMRALQIVRRVHVAK
jgi:[2Fe-2S] binding domain